MKTALTLPILTAAVIAASPAMAASSHDQSSAALGLKATERHSDFLSPLQPRFVLSKAHPLYPNLCAQLPGKRRCPVITTPGGVVGGGVIHDDLPLTSHLPNVRVTMYIQSISNQAIDNGGVKGHMADALQLVTWETDGPESDVQKGGPYAWSLPAPGETFETAGGAHAGPLGLRVYDALVYNACDNLTSFDMEHDATIDEGGTELGAFSGTDSSTIGSTGYYNAAYTVRATDGDGGVSDFRFEGKVNVICSGLNALP